MVDDTQQQTYDNGYMEVERVVFEDRGIANSVLTNSLGLFQTWVTSGEDDVLVIFLHTPTNMLWFNVKGRGRIVIPAHHTAFITMKPRPDTGDGSDQEPTPA